LAIVIPANEAKVRIGTTGTTDTGTTESEACSITIGFCTTYLKPFLNASLAFSSVVKGLS
jgi:hypothetical protein